MSSWTVRAYRPGDEAGINDLFNAVFQRRRPLSAWYWKFDRNLAAGAKVIAIGETENGKIVGAFPSVPVRFRFGDRSVIAVHALDNCIAPDYHVGGRMQVALWHEWVRQVREIGAAFGYGFPNEVNYIVGKRLLKWMELSPLLFLDRRMSFRQALHQRTESPVLRQTGEAVATRLIGLGLGWHGLSSPRDVVIDEVVDFDEEFDTLWQRINSGAVVFPIRDRAYLRWRYVENPGGGFRILRASRGGQLAGYLVGKIQKEPDGTQVAYILDVATEDEASLHALLREALREFHAARVDWTRCGLLPHRASAGPFRAVGFRRVVSRIRVAYVVWDETLDRQVFANPTQWDFSLGDSDIFSDGA